MSDVPLSKLLSSVSSWSERQEAAEPFTAEKRRILAMQIASAKIWRRPEDQDDTEEPEVAALKTRGPEHLRRLREEAMTLSWEDLGFDGLTDAKVDAMLCHIRETCSTTAAAAIEVGIDPSLLRRWLQEGRRLAEEPEEAFGADPITYARRKRLFDLAMDIARAQNDPINHAARTMVTLAKQGDSDAAKFVLLHSPRGARQWGRKSEVRHKGNVQHDHTHRPAPGALSHLRQMSVTELEKRLALQNEALSRPEFDRPTYDAVIEVDGDD